MNCADNEAGIESLYAAWRDAFQRRDLEAIIGLLTPDYILWAPGRAPTDVAALRPQLAAALVAYDVDSTFEREERLMGGDLAIECGWDVQTLRPRDGGAARTGRQRVLLVLRRSSDGRWRFARGMSQPGPAA
ncbi:MAG: nuclear transport factor 2 family protein [Acidobacteriia bacterium]|nr:nuclear transport factor 2 family protein [Terriglobia bacterium]